MNASNGGPLDLRGVPCPLNFFKVRARLEALPPGEALEVLLDEGEPVTSVSRRIRQEGHRVRGVNRLGDHYRVTIERGG